MLDCFEHFSLFEPDPTHPEDEGVNAQFFSVAKEFIRGLRLVADNKPVGHKIVEGIREFTAFVAAAGRSPRGIRLIFLEQRFATCVEASGLVFRMQHSRVIGMLSGIGRPASTRASRNMSTHLATRSILSVGAAIQASPRRAALGNSGRYLSA